MPQIKIFCYKQDSQEFKKINEKSDDICKPYIWEILIPRLHKLPTTQEKTAEFKNEHRIGMDVFFFQCEMEN